MMTMLLMLISVERCRR